MTYQAKITSLYRKQLGQNIKNTLNHLGLKHNEIGEDTPDGDVDFLSETAVGEIIKGRRNLSAKSLYAFLSTFNYTNPLELFLPDDAFCLEIISELCSLILTDSIFENTILNYKLTSRLNKYYSQANQINQFIQESSDQLLDSLKAFFGDFPDEETSDEIARKLTDWLSELACIITQSE